MRSIVDYVMIFKGRGLKMGVFVGGGGGGGGGGVDLDLDFKNFWDGVYYFFFAPPLGLRCLNNKLCDRFQFCAANALRLYFVLMGHLVGKQLSASSGEIAWRNDWLVENKNN